MNRAELVQNYVSLMGADAEERNFYKELATLTESEIIKKIIELAFYYQEIANH